MKIMRANYLIRNILFLALAFSCPQSNSGDAVNKETTTNVTGCRCSAKACCLCVNEKLDAALTVTLTGPTEKAILKIIPADGPRFDDENGPREKEQNCEPSPGNTKTYALYGGTKTGEYSIEVWINGVKKDVCRTFCVFPKGSDVDVDKNKTDCFNYPPGWEPGTAQATRITEIANDEGLTVGLACGLTAGYSIGGSPISVEPFGDSPYHYLYKDGKKQKIVWPGSSANLPENLGSGHKYASCADDCDNKIEVYCAGRDYKVYFIDCNGNYYLIGNCKFTAAQNALYVTFSECNNKKRFGQILMFNKDLESDDFNAYLLDACSLNRIEENQDGVVSDGKAPVVAPPAP